MLAHSYNRFCRIEFVLNPLIDPKSNEMFAPVYAYMCYCLVDVTIEIPQPLFVIPTTNPRTKRETASRNPKRKARSKLANLFLLQLSKHEWPSRTPAPARFPRCTRCTCHPLRQRFG